MGQVWRNHRPKLPHVFGAFFGTLRLDSAPFRCFLLPVRAIYDLNQIRCLQPLYSWDNRFCVNTFFSRGRNLQDINPNDLLDELHFEEAEKKARETADYAAKHGWSWDA